MNFKHLKNLQESIDGMKKIFSIAWSPNLIRIAVAHVDEKRNVRISLFDENGEKKETFPTRAANKTNKSYVVRDIIFSPDSTKLAVSQSDNIVFVYNLGTNWGDKKTICNKFEQNTQVTSMIWPLNKPNDIYFGLAEGKIKQGMLKSNSAQVLYSTDSYVVSMCSSADGKFVFTAHLDYSVYKYSIESTQAFKIINFSSIPYSLACGVNNNVLCAGNDCKVVIYKDTGDKIQAFDYSYDLSLKDFTLARSNSNFDTIAVGNYDKFFVFMFNFKKNQWEEGCVRIIENYYTVTALGWKSDVNTLVTGSLCGSIDIFESCLKKSIYGEKFEIIHISYTQIMIKNLENSKHMTIKSSNEIEKLSIHNDNYIVIHAKNSLIIGDINSKKFSEISWCSTDHEKYDFSNNNICMIFHSGEIAFIEFGNNNILGHIITDYIHPNLISARVKNSKLIVAYLVDSITLNIQHFKDLNTLEIISTISHPEPIEFIDLNRLATKIIIRDNKRHLYLYKIYEGRKLSLLNFCGFVQWVPECEVLVAQDRKNLIIFYNIDENYVENMKIENIKGEIQEVRKTNDRTEVIVEEGEIKIYLLDENLIRLSIAIEERDLVKSVNILESMPESEIYWKTLSKLALQNKNLPIAQRCYAAIGAYSKANYIKKIMKDVENLSLNHPIVEAKLMILDKQFINAENLLIKNNLINEAITIFNDIHRYEDSMKIAERYKINDYKDLNEKYFKWLIENQNYDKAADIKLNSGETYEAIKLYIQGDFYIKAANLIIREKFPIDKKLIELLINSINEMGVYDKAAELCEYVEDYDRSFLLYLKGNSYHKALQIAKFIGDINRIKQVEEQWGDYLSLLSQTEQSVNHYIEADRIDKAIESLISIRQWEKASDMCNKYSMTEEYYKRIADHYVKEKNYEMAEKYYLKNINSNYPCLVEIYTKSKKWEKLENLVENMSKSKFEYKEILLSLAEKYKNDSKYKEAEKLYIVASEPEIAITMYKNIKKFDEMIKLVKSYLPGYLNETCQMIASISEQDNNIKQAEKYLLISNQWKLVVDMYYRNQMIDECLKVAYEYSSKNNESEEEFLNICIKIFSQNIEEGMNTLIRLNMVDECIKFLCLSNKYEFALNVAENKSINLIPYILLQYGTEMKNVGNFEKAEECFIKGGKPKEAVWMYLKTNDFINSLRIARKHCEDMVSEIYFKQGKSFIQSNEIEKAEICMLKAKCPEEIFEAYMNIGEQDKAFSFAEKYAPVLLSYLNENDKIVKLFEKVVNANIKSTIQKCILCEKSKHINEAIELYLQISQNEMKEKSYLIIIYDRVLELSKFTDLQFKKKCFDVLVRKFLSLEEYKRAADILYFLGNYEEAVNCYVSCGQIQEARNIINNTPNETDKDYLESVINKKLDSNEIYEILINDGKYEECLTKIIKMKSELFNKYFIRIASTFFTNKQYFELTSLIINVNPTFTNKTISILKTLALEILAEENIEELENLKLLFEKKEENYKVIAPEYIRMHMITHFQYIKYLVKENENKLSDLFYCLCITVLQYGNIIKLDLALLDAIKVCKKLKIYGNVYIFTIKYLELYEFLEFGTSPKDDSDSEIDFIPFKNFYCSANNIITPVEKEELNKWIINYSVDKNIHKSLNSVNCLKCDNKLFEAELKCKICNFEYEQCIVSGFPIRDKYIVCINCSKKANEKFWKNWINVFHYCPWCRCFYNSV